MRRLIKIYDTTLRDGTQGEGISFSMEDKVRLATRLDALGIHYIEGGWPGSNPKDLRFFRRMQDVTFKHAKLAAFSMTRRAGGAADSDANMRALLDAGAPVATIVGKSWDFHVTHALSTTLDENLKMIADTIAFLRPRMEEVMFDAEHFFDGFRRNREYALATLQSAEAAGAQWLVLCDTNGGTLPHDLVAGLRVGTKHVKTPLGIHVHNDAESALANSPAAVAAGGGESPARARLRAGGQGEHSLEGARVRDRHRPRHAGLAADSRRAQGARGPGVPVRGRGGVVRALDGARARPAQAVLRARRVPCDRRGAEPRRGAGRGGDGARTRQGHPRAHGGVRQRARQCARPRAPQGARGVLPEPPGDAAARLQGAHPRRVQGHRGKNPRADHLGRRRGDVGHGGGRGQHHRGVLAGAPGLDRVHAAPRRAGALS